jgi:hypothetical protein
MKVNGTQKGKEKEMARKKSDIDPDEIKQHAYTPYVMLALAQLGC